MKTRTVLGVAGAVVVLGLVMGADKVVSAQAETAPPGVATGSWIAITPGFGVVVDPRQMNHRSNTMYGDFMVLRDGHWWRLKALGVGLAPVRMTVTEQNAQ